MNVAQDEGDDNFPVFVNKGHLTLVRACLCGCSCSICARRLCVRVRRIILLWVSQAKRKRKQPFKFVAGPASGKVADPASAEVSRLRLRLFLS